MWKVGIFVFGGINQDSLSDILAICEAANSFTGHDASSRPLLDVRLVTAESQYATAGKGVDVPARLSSESAFDVFCVPSGDVGSIVEDRNAIRELQRARSESFVLAGIGTGCTALAVAGLLRGRVAVDDTIAPVIAQLCPEVEIDTDAAYVDQGDLVTASASCASDLTLHLVTRAGGRRLALNVVDKLGLTWNEEAGDEVPPRAGEGLI